MSETTRRALLAGAAGLGAAGALAACGADGGSSAGAQPGGGGGSAGPLAKTSDIPVGGGKVFETAQVVVTQPTAGNFKAFTAVCTHMGCTVSSVQNDTISCLCHGSQYSAEDGSVKTGPAPRALAPKNIKVEGDSISLA